MSMINGFRFNGKHSSAFNLEYIPSAQNRVLNMPDYSVREETVTGRNGGYYYGRQANIREFALECFFEDLTAQRYDDMMRWLCTGEEGELIFDERPYVAYRVRSWKLPGGKVYTSENDVDSEKLYAGTLTVYFKAYDPFGRMLYKTYETVDEDGAEKTCGIVRASDMPPAVTAKTGTFLIYNPGTYRSDTIIRIGGTAAKGLTITNETTNEKCTLIRLPGGDSYLELDSSAGSVRVLPEKPDEMAFEYHEEGYITLAPCTPYERHVFVEYAAKSNHVTFPTFTLTQERVGQYIHIAGKWLRISSLLDEHHAVVSEQLESAGTEETILATMNVLRVEGTGATLTKLEVDYVPRVR